MKKQIKSTVGDWSHWSPTLKEALESSKNNTQVGAKKWYLKIMNLGYGVYTYLQAFHKHSNRYFWTALSEGKSRSYYHDGSIIDTEYESGDVMYFADLNKDNYFIHNLENNGETTLIFTTVEFVN